MWSQSSHQLCKVIKILDASATVEAITEVSLILWSTVSAAAVGTEMYSATCCLLLTNLNLWRSPHWEWMDVSIGWPNYNEGDGWYTFFHLNQSTICWVATRALKTILEKISFGLTCMMKNVMLTLNTTSIFSPNSLQSAIIGTNWLQAFWIGTV